MEGGKFVDKYFRFRFKNVVVKSVYLDPVGKKVWLEVWRERARAAMQFNPLFKGVKRWVSLATDVASHRDAERPNPLLNFSAVDARCAQ